MSEKNGFPIEVCWWPEYGEVTEELFWKVFNSIRGFARRGESFAATMDRFLVDMERRNLEDPDSVRSISERMKGVSG
jgi:hypothetical protein